MRRPLSSPPAVVAALACTAFLGGTAAQQVPTVIDFEDLGSGRTEFVLPTKNPFEYRGLRWEGVYVVNVSHPIVETLQGSGYRPGCTSGSFIGVLNSRLVPYSEIVAPPQAVMAINSLTLTALWRNGMQMSIEGYRGSTLVNSKRVELSASEPAHIELGFDGIDRIRFTSSGGRDVDICGAGQCSPGPEAALDDFVLSLFPLTLEPLRLTAIDPAKLWDEPPEPPEPPAENALLSPPAPATAATARPRPQAPQPPEPVSAPTGPPPPSAAAAAETASASASPSPGDSDECDEFGFWGVQTGAYRSEKNALSGAAKLRDRFQPARVYVNPAGGVPVWRVVVGCAASVAEANQLWERLRVSGVNGVVVFAQPAQLGSLLSEQR